MFCRECRGTLYDRRSDLCLACGAIETLKEEFKEPWNNGRLRDISADIVVSALRSVRALRICGKSPALTPAAAAERKPLERRRTSKGKEAEKPTCSTKVEEESKGRSRRGSPLPEERVNRGGRAQGSVPDPDLKEEAHSYSYTTESSDFEVKDLTGKEPVNKEPESSKGATPKSKAKSPSRGKEKATKVHSHRGEEKNSKRRQSPIAAKVEIGSEEDKRKSKEAYLAAQKTQITLREGPKEKRKPAISQNLLEIVGDREIKPDEGSKRKRRK